MPSSPPGDRFVVVGCPTLAPDLPTAVLTSADGTAWTLQDAGLRNDCLIDVTWTGGSFVAVGTEGLVISSPDGVVWSIQDAGVPFSAFLTGVASSGTRLVAVGNDQAPILITSDDGLAWTSRELGIDAGQGSLQLNSVAWSGTQFVVVGGQTRFVSTVNDEGGLIATSPDGMTWTRQASGTSESATLSRVTTVGSQLIVLGSPDVGVLTSNNGTTWLPWMSALSYPPVWQLSGVAGSDAQFVLVGQFGTVITSR